MKDTFNLCRVHIRSTAQDQQIFPIDNREITVGVKCADVAGMQAPLTDAFARRIGAPPVAEHRRVDVGPLAFVDGLDTNFAGFAGLQKFRILVANRHLDVRERYATCTEYVLVQRVDGGSSRHFGQAIDTVDRDAKFAFECFDDRLWTVPSTKHHAL